MIRTKDELKGAMAIIVVFLIIFIFVFGLWHVAIRPINEAADDFCQEIGYEEHTDYKSYFAEPYDFKVECDGDDIYKVDAIDKCEEYNKWGDCVKESVEFK